MEDQMALESLHNQIQELKNEIIVQKQLNSSNTQVLLLHVYSIHNIYNLDEWFCNCNVIFFKENEILKSALKEKDEARNTITDEEFGIVESMFLILC